MKYKLISAHNNTSDALFYNMHGTDLKCSKKIPFLLFDTVYVHVNDPGDDANRCDALKNENIDVIK